MHRIIDVYLPFPAWKPYSYDAGDCVMPNDPQGCRVVVPVRRGWKVGICWRRREAESSEGLLEARGFIESVPSIPPDLWDLGMWMSSHYMCPPGITLQSMLPGSSRTRVTTVLDLCPNAASSSDQSGVPEDAGVVLRLLAAGSVSRDAMERTLCSSRVDAAAGWLVEHGIAVWRIEMASPSVGRTVAIARLAPEQVPAKVSAAGARLLDVLKTAGGRLAVAELITRASVSRSVLGTLSRMGLVVVEHVPQTSPSLRDGPAAHPPTYAQERATQAIIAALTRRQFASFLLHGVTGSGKTEVYLAAAAFALDQGSSVLCLVPEIALTAQMVARFRGRLGDRVILLHSGLSAGERQDAWKRASSMPASLVIGPRSALFAPVRSLGLVVVDEEHDASYKQERDPRYHGRDVAIMRAHQAGCPVVLGSATPSLESYQHCLTGKHVLLELPERVDGWHLPVVSIVDMRVEPKLQGPLIFSALLQRRLHEVLERGEQALLLLNRRGYARSVQCADCGFIPQCPDCDISLTFHRRDLRHVCHYCDYAEPAGEECPSCGGRRLGFGSVGTERVEEELRSLHPGLRVLRMDRDTTRSRGAHVRIIDSMEREEASVLVGTQMIAKGLDLPKVTLVGVVNADTPLQFPDFRAGERAFQLLSQVAGRAGRSRAGGEVILQSLLVDYPVLLCAARHDYASFAREELMDRKEAGYPPFARLARLEVRGQMLKAVESHARSIAEGLHATREGQGARLLGPAPPLLPRMKGLHRRHVLVFHRSHSRLHAWLKRALAQAGDHHGTRLVVDIDPLETV